MDDKQIIGLYNQRNERAISETANKYGNFLYSIAYNFSYNHEDSEEIVNDTYMNTWNSIPPRKPASLKAYLGRITRNLSINLWYKKKALKRNSGMTEVLSELEDTVPSPNTVEDEIDLIALTELINQWLASLDVESRVLFMRRYWYGDNLDVLAKEAKPSINVVSGRLYKLRQKLKKRLEEEGVNI